MKMKLKMNNGCITFKHCKKIQPIKFDFKKEEDKNAIHRKHLMKNEYFKENPHLIEFAKK